MHDPPRRIADRKNEKHGQHIFNGTQVFGFVNKTWTNLGMSDWACKLASYLQTFFFPNPSCQPRPAAILFMKMRGLFLGQADRLSQWEKNIPASIDPLLQCRLWFSCILFIKVLDDWLMFDQRRLAHISWYWLSDAAERLIKDGYKKSANTCALIAEATGCMRWN